MRSHAVLVLLPFLASVLAQAPVGVEPGAAATALASCAGEAAGPAQRSCIFGALGAVPAAASYLASVGADPQIGPYIDSVFQNPTFQSVLTQAGATFRALDGGEGLTALNPIGVEATIVQQFLSAYPTGTVRDVVSSVFAEVDAIQATGSPASAGAAAPARQTGLGVMAGVMAGVLGAAVVL